MQWKKFVRNHIANNTWARVDVELHSTAHEWVQRTRKMWSWTREEKFHICKQPFIIIIIIFFLSNKQNNPLQTKRPWIENGEGFTFHSSTRPRCAKGEWRVSSWLAITKTQEKIRYFSTCVFTAFLRAENICLTPLLIR